MKKDEAISILATSLRPREPKDRARYDEAVKMAIKALNCSEIPNNSDVISKQAALETIRTMQTYKLFAGDDMLLIDQAEAQTELMMLPPAQPEHKTGRWIPDNTDYYRTKFICSACGESEEVPTTGFGYGTMWDYCPMCGAKMERRQNGH